MVGQVLAEMPAFLVPVRNPLAVIALSLALAAFGAVVLAAAYGMWTFQAWGRRLQAIVCMTDLLLNGLILWANPPSAGNLLAVAGLYLDSVILIFISFPEVQRLYANDAWGANDNLLLVTEGEPRTPSL